MLLRPVLICCTAFVRYWHLADIQRRHVSCPLLARSRHAATADGVSTVATDPKRTLGELPSRISGKPRWFGTTAGATIPTTIAYVEDSCDVPKKGGEE